MRSGFYQPRWCVGGSRSLSVCDFSGKDGWKKLDVDVRPAFHLVAGYLLSKHRSQLTNESDRQTGSEE